MEFWKNNIEFVNPKNISETDLKKITEIEKDMWSYWIGEYVKCENCGEIHSKQDIFWHLSKDIYLETVSKIENILWLNRISCPNCNSDTEFIYDESDYINEIKERYNNSINSFLTVFRDENWEIRAFEDWYIDNFDNIFQREFEKYYSLIWKNRIIIEIEKILWWKIPEKILLCCSIWTEQKYSSFFIFYKMMYNFFSNISNMYNENILWLYEAVVWWLPHSIYHICWTDRVWIPQNNLYENVINNGNLKSDIFVHNNVINTVLNSISLPVKEFVRKNKKEMRIILKQ